MFEAALLDAVKLIRLESPDATAKEVHARLIAEGLNVELGQVKKVARQVTKCAAEGPSATPLKVPPSAPASAAIRCLRLHGLPPELAHLNGEHAVVSEACTEAESATLLSAECAKVLTLLSKCSVTVPLACMELTDAPADVLFSNNEFAVVKTPGRGLGMRAQRALKKHELVLRENPLSGSINIGRSTSTMGASDAVLWQLLQELEPFSALDHFPPAAVAILEQVLARVAQLDFDQLPPAKQQRWMALHDTFSPPEGPKQPSQVGRAAMSSDVPFDRPSSALVSTRSSPMASDCDCRSAEHLAEHLAVISAISPSISPCRSSGRMRTTTTRPAAAACMNYSAARITRACLTSSAPLWARRSW